MDTEKARELLSGILGGYRTMGYEDLANLIGNVDTAEIESGFQVEVQVFWDDEPRGNVRVIGAIDNRGVRALAPLTDSFIMNPQGGFVGESAQ